jgi:trimeric autotransporter adhesin
MFLNIGVTRLIAVYAPLRRARLFACLVVLLTPALAPATWADSGPAFLVRDINSAITQRRLDIVTGLVVLGTRVYFVADDVHDVYGLWSSDGTVAGTMLVKELPAYPHDMENVGGILYFAVSDYDGLHALWKSDGTTVGTTQIKSFTPMSSPLRCSYPQLTSVNGKVFFVADDEASGFELWKSDGTAAGTVLVKDIYPGAQSSEPSALINVNGTLFFVANDGDHGFELWKSDGTATGTVLVKDKDPGSQSGFMTDEPIGMTNVNGTLFFPAAANTDGLPYFNLWKSDGTAAGTVLVKGGDAFGVSAGSLVNVNGELFFVAYGDEKGYELWKSDGTTAGTVIVKDIHPGAGSSFSTGLAAANSILYFSADDGVSGQELWRSDGTAAGTYMVKDINPGRYGSAIGSLQNVGGMLFFTAYNGQSSLWRSDGTAAGTIPLQPAPDFPGPFARLGETILFFMQIGGLAGELWRTDGTPAGTMPIPLGTSGVASQVAGLEAVDGTLFFAADDGIHGGELWKSDGTTAGTVLVRDINPGAPSSEPVNLTNVAGTLFFSAGTGPGSRGLWRSDGTAAGTLLVTDTLAGELTDVAGTLFFLAMENYRDGNYRIVIFKSDGTTVGTAPVAAINGAFHLSAAELESVGDTLFFTVTAAASP